VSHTLEVIPGFYKDPERVLQILDDPEVEIRLEGVKLALLAPLVQGLALSKIHPGGVLNVGLVPEEDAEDYLPPPKRPRRKRPPSDPR